MIRLLFVIKYKDNNPFSKSKIYPEKLVIDATHVVAIMTDAGGS